MYAEQVRLEVKLLDKQAVVPTRKRDTDAGYDIYSINEAIIPPHGVVNFNTGLAIAAPPGYYYTIEGRSSLWKKGVTPYRGIIDATYTGPLMVAVANNSDIPYEVQKFDRIAQMILHKIIPIHFEMVDEFSPQYNQRGDAGFGSSGR